MENYAIIPFMTLLGMLFVGGGMIGSWLLSYHSPENEHKRIAYECGELTIGTTHVRFKVGYYLFALMFMIFDVETLFLFPCVRIYNEIAQGKIPGLAMSNVMIELVVFFTILAFGLLYAWRKGVLRWS